MRSAVESTYTPGRPDAPPRWLFERRVDCGVGFAIERSGDEQLRWHRFAGEMGEDGPHGLGADLVRELDGVGVNLACFDGLLALRLAVEADELDLIGLAGFFQRGASAQG